MANLNEQTREFVILENLIPDLRLWNHKIITEKLQTEPVVMQGWVGAFLDANISFHQGIFPQPVRTSRVQRFAVTLSLLVLRVFALHSLTFIQLLSNYVCRRLSTKELAASLVSLRYTNFLLGFVYSAALAQRFSSVSAEHMHNYYLGLLGHFLCLLGFFSVGLPLLERSIQKAQSEKHPHSTQFFQAELTAIFGMHQVYSGDLHAANTTLNQLVMQLESEPYVWLEVFTRSMRITLATERIDSGILLTDSARLQRILGPGFQSKYGLRTLICSALIAGLKADPVRSFSLIRQAETLYQNQASKVELGRYHILRALTELEIGESSRALYHSMRSVSFLEGIEGAIYHSVEAKLLEAEIALRSLLVEPTATGMIAARLWKSRLKRSIRRIHGAPGLYHRAELLMALASALAKQLDYEEIAQTLSGFQANASPRLKRFIENTRNAKLSEKSAISAEGYLGAAENSTAEFVRLMSSSLENDVTPEILSSLFKTVSLAEKVTYIGSNEADDESSYPGKLTIEVTNEEMANVKICLGSKVHSFTLSHPLLQIEVNPVAGEQLNLVSKLVMAQHSRINQVQFERASAIARTTQALAHDVRKPFSMLKMVLGNISEAENPIDAQDIAKASLPEVNQAMASVEGMIQDVMQIGADSKPHLEIASPESIIVAAVNELFRIFPESDVSLIYELLHTHSLNVDTLRVGRVFSNILVNAVQAMNGKGMLWIKTKEVRIEAKSYIEFRIGNSGSCIPPEALSKLFDAFFTAGKKGGTGLGLAIAQKVVTDHGGTIRCRSEKTQEHPNGFVEFAFTLPTSDRLNIKPSDELPSHSRVIHAQLARLKTKDPVAATADELEQELQVCKKLKTLNGQFPTLLIVDDEAVYRNSLERLLQRGDSEVTKIPVAFAKNFDEAVLACATLKPFLVIQDIDLGTNSPNGIEVIKMVRSSGFANRVCVHSNRFLFEDQKIAMEAGADTVLPKPMSRAHLLKLVASALADVTPVALVRPEVSAATAGVLRQPRLAYVDDSRTFTISWKMKLKAVIDLDTFSSSEEFFEKAALLPEGLHTFDAIVTDYYFGPGDPHNGRTFAAKLREMGFKGPVYLASNGDFTAEQVKPEIDGVISKDIPSLEMIMGWLPNSNH